MPALQNHSVKYQGRGEHHRSSGLAIVFIHMLLQTLAQEMKEKQDESTPRSNLLFLKLVHDSAWEESSSLKFHERLFNYVTLNCSARFKINNSDNDFMVFYALHVL